MTIDKSRADALTDKQRSAIDDSARVLEENWEHVTADRLRDAFAIEPRAVRHAANQADWRGDFERQASAVGFDMSREEIGGEYCHPDVAAAFCWYYTGRLDEACSGTPVDQTPAAAPLSMLRALIADSAHAATFQTMGQYRAALLAAIDDGRLRSSSDYVFQLACGRIQAALTHLGAALASFPKSASEACIEQAVRILQGRYVVGGIVAGESSDQVPAILSPRREYFVDETKAARTGVYQYRDTGSLETGEDHDRQ
ncbi:hypothetical protein [Burkholderia anthina]|uniref:hypothetical protein n=1 Tax=Burkholderia anthina TaxID=179879 RepID=UPI001FC8DE70|nr:hypothetical protein [Burkholderia anthina]